MKFSLLIFLLTLTACARPDYISKKDLLPTNKPESTAECPWLFKHSDVCMNLHWNTTPTSTDYSDFTITFINSTEPFDEIQVLLWMPSMGHGSSPVKVTAITAQQFHISEVFFIMPGDWEIRFTLKKSGDTVDQLNLPLFIP